MSGKREIDGGRGWIVAFAGCAINTWTFGVFYAFATALEQMVDEFNASLSGIAAFFSVTTFLFFAVGMLAGPLADRFGARRLVAVGAFLMGGGLWLTAQVESLLAGIVIYGLGVGLGIGSYLVPLSVATGAWFEKHRTLALGINTVGIGLGTLILVPFAEWLIRTAGWRSAFELMGIGSAIVYAVVALLSFRPPTPPASVSVSISAARRAIRKSEFWRLYAAGFLMSVALFIPFVFLVQYAKEQGIASSTAAFLITSLGLGSVLGRLGLGVLGMRLGVLPLIIMCFGIQPIAYVLWLLSGSNYLLLLLFAGLLGVGYGGFVALSPVAMAGIFGLEGLGGVLGVQYTSAGVGALIGPIAAGAIIDATGSYTVAIIGAIVVSLAATVSVLPMWRLGDGTPSETLTRSFLSQPTVWLVSPR
ncbi:MAG: MFS transporter [Acidimicrobiales bacterium]|jgi:MFS family permease|nr:MFS transporter [Acidimicrobiales bacterium]|tara:strand:+ start:244 stop:1497 length:1254 start_codon:yes stop_codon:yes gene_type:complete